MAFVHPVALKSYFPVGKEKETLPLAGVAVCSLEVVRFTAVTSKSLILERVIPPSAVKETVTVKFFCYFII